MTNALASIRSTAGLAAYFGLTYPQLARILYSDSPPRYTQFEIPKKSGQSRVICAPNERLKSLQRRFAHDLNDAYVAPPSAHGFLMERSIATNATMHLDKRYVFNIDLQDFFGTIHFGRVLGLFMAWPFNFDRSVATVLAQLCCFENRLPQGAPTSPVISNMIARGLDRELEALAKRHRCTYTRYVDDITFSFTCTWPRLPRDIIAVDGRAVQCGPELTRVIEKQGFRVNPMKVYLAGQSARMEVTGITVNAWPNVSKRLERQVSAMLHAWDKYGLHAARDDYNKRWRRNHHHLRTLEDFEDVVHGKLCFMRYIKGDGNPSFNRLANRFNGLATRDSLRFPITTRVSDVWSATGAIWVVESDQGTGTAFALKSVGLVTCAHVVGDIVTGKYRTNIKVFRYDKPHVEYRVRRVQWDRDRDLATLHAEVDLDELPGAHLEPSNRTARTGLPVSLMGFPNYASGHEPYVVSTKAIRVVPHMGRAMLEVSEQIRPGLSGGPVVDNRGCVVAVVDSRVSANDDGTLAGGNYAILLAELEKASDWELDQLDPSGRVAWWAPANRQSERVPTEHSG